MLLFVARRLVQAIVVLLTVAFVAFLVSRHVGDPVATMVGVDTSATDRAALRERLGLNDPLPVQFVQYVAGGLHGDFGLSYRMGEPVLTVIASRIPATLELALVATLLAVGMGVVLGVYTGLRRRGALARLVLTASLIGVSLPTFLTGILLIWIFSVQCRSWATGLSWLSAVCMPSFGRGEVVSLGFWSTGFLTESGRRALILPGLTLGLFQLALILRLVRSQMLEVLQTDHIRFARARGLTERAINFGHALKNTLVPVITIIGLQLGAVIAFAIVTETVFQWPGMGQLFLTSVQFADIPVITTYLVLVALCFVIINLAVDLLYHVVDPRLRQGGGAD
jgi:peptide/nickel transport system permease protein